MLKKDWPTSKKSISDRTSQCVRLDSHETYRASGLLEKLLFVWSFSRHVLVLVLLIIYLFLGTWGGKYDFANLLLCMAYLFLFQLLGIHKKGNPREFAKLSRGGLEFYPEYLGGPLPVLSDSIDSWFPPQEHHFMCSCVHFPVSPVDP